MCHPTFRNEFKLRNFLLDHDDSDLFVSSQWKWPQPVYVAYRAVAAIYFVIWIVLSGTGTSGSAASAKWFIYLTNWSFFMLTLNNIWMLATSTYALIQSHRKVAQLDEVNKPALPWYLKAQWVIYNVSILAALLVTLAYWALLYSPGKWVSEVNFHVHAVNSIYVLLDLWICAMPLRLLHYWHSVIYGAVYVAIFTPIYIAAGGTNRSGDPYIYPVLDFFGRPGLAVGIVFGALLVGLPLLWLLLFGLVTLRRYLSRSCCRCGRDYDQSYDLKADLVDRVTINADEKVANGGSPAEVKFVREAGGSEETRDPEGGVVNVAFEKY